jgi:hypothetical protein
MHQHLFCFLLLNCTKQSRCQRHCHCWQRFLHGVTKSNTEGYFILDLTANVKPI